jgi:thiosulfate/3-mercaptopyruvate sulfurtransferase
MLIALVAIEVASSFLGPTIQPGVESRASIDRPAPTVRTEPRFEFMSARRLHAMIGTREMHLIDARSTAKYLAGHIPGAVRLSDESLREATTASPAAMLPAERLGSLFGRHGVGADRPVAVYADGEDPLPAALVAYALIKAGHRDVCILDGGFAAWQGEVSPQYPVITPIEWRAEPDPTLAADFDDVNDAIDQGEVTLIDARPPRLFRGEGRSWARNGHIPTAINLDWHTIVRSDNESLLRPESEIKSAIERAGLDPAEPTIVYCGTGREATLLFLYLRGVKGHTRARLYEGSWTEYQARPGTVCVTGDEPYVPVRTDGEMNVSGQPARETLRELHARGIRMVINCRTPGETRDLGFDERAFVLGLGMKYDEIPLGGAEGFEPADIERLAHLLAGHGGSQGVLLHCAGGPRAATLWAAYLSKHRGLSPAEAVQRVRDAGMLRETSIERLLGVKLLPAPATGQDSSSAKQ